MEAFYYLDRQTQYDGKHLVHTHPCEMQEKLFPIKLGWKENSQLALKEAYKYYNRVRLCEKCTENILRKKRTHLYG